MKLIAFLRAINVGGHTVTMAALREHFESLRLANVETFIASGNVIFESSAKNVAALERRIEAQLEKSLGYEVKTFVRTEIELAAVATHTPFTESRRQSARALYVGFLAEPLSATGTKTLMALKTEIDDFHVHGREVYWLCQTGQGDSKFSNMAFEKALKTRVTFRGVNTITRLAAKYGLSPR